MFAENKMRVNLEDRIKDLSRQPQSYVEEVPYGADGSEQPASQDPSHRLALLTAIQRSHSVVRSTCVNRALEVVKLVQHYKGTRFFAYDAALVRDGAFFAAELLADEHGMDEHVECVYQVLGEMRWAFCRSELYRHRLNVARETRLAREREGSASVGSPATMSEGSSQSQGRAMVMSVSPAPAPLPPPPMPAPIQAVPYVPARTSGSGSGSDSQSPTSSMGTATSTLVSPTAVMHQAAPHYRQPQHMHPLTVPLSGTMAPIQQRQALQRGPSVRDPPQPLAPSPLHQATHPLAQPGFSDVVYEVQPTRLQPTPAPLPAQFDTYMPAGVHPSQLRQQQQQPLPPRVSQPEPQALQQQQQQQQQQHHHHQRQRQQQQQPAQAQAQYAFVQPPHQPLSSWHPPSMGNAQHPIPREIHGAGPSQQQEWPHGLLQGEQMGGEQGADIYNQQRGVSKGEGQQGQFAEIRYPESTPSPPLQQLQPTLHQQLQPPHQHYPPQYTNPNVSPTFIYPQHLHGQQLAHGQQYGMASAPRATGDLASLYEPPPPLAPDRSALLQNQHQLNLQQQQQPLPPQNTTTAWNQPQHPQQQVEYHSYYQPQ